MAGWHSPKLSVTNLTNVQSIQYSQWIGTRGTARILCFSPPNPEGLKLGKLARQRYYLGTYMCYTVHKAKTRQGIGIGIDSLEPNVKDMIADIPLHVNLILDLKAADIPPDMPHI